MAKTYVIGIGGTGSRIIRALMLLLASGADTKGHAIVPVLIDLDLSNGDTSESFRLVEAYIELRNKLYEGRDASSDGYFLRTKVEALREGQSAQESSKISFIESNQEFAEFIGYKRSEQDTASAVLSELDSGFIESLFSTSTKKGEEELELNMSRGFKGHPNIGVLAFNEIKKNEDFIDLLNNAASEGNKIFIVSSIFGGTGASGFPQIIKLIEAADQPKERNGLGVNAGIKRIPVGALSVFPYFNLQVARNGKDSSISSSTFMTKSKAALYYYENQLSRLNRMYNLYDDPQVAFENNSGGEDQRNDAHWIELVGAYSVIDFIQSDINVNGQESLAFFSAYRETEGGIPGEISYNHFFGRTKQDVLVPIIKAGIIWFIFEKCIPQDRKDASPYIIDLNLDKNSSGEYEFYNFYKSFLVAYFKKWIDEVQRNHRTIKLFDFNANYLTDFLWFKKISKEDGEQYNILNRVNSSILTPVASEIRGKHKNLRPEQKIAKFIETAVEQIVQNLKL
jgi:hypothetical protein